MKKLVLITPDNCKKPSFGYSVAEAFNKLGWEIYCCSYRKLQFHRFFLTKSILNNIIYFDITRIKPDLVLVIKGEGLK